MPTSIFQRVGSPQSYADDTPITPFGQCCAQLIGHGLIEAKLVPTHVFCSPALRCVQTADAIARGADSHLRVAVEPGLFEWAAYTKALPIWMTNEELRAAGMKVSIAYQPIITAERFRHCHNNETSVKYYIRMMDVMNQILKEIESKKKFNPLGIVNKKLHN